MADSYGKIIKKISVVRIADQCRDMGDCHDYLRN